MPASAFTAGLFGLATNGAMSWSAETLAAFRLCAGDASGAPRMDAYGSSPERLLFRLDGEEGGEGGGGGGRRGRGHGTEAQQEATRATKRARFGDLPLEEAGHWDGGCTGRRWGCPGQLGARNELKPMWPPNVLQ
jgi:hypothetical protein